MYRCLKCGRVLTLEDMYEVKGTGRHKKLGCPYCNYRAFGKLRPGGVKTIKAR